MQVVICRSRTYILPCVCVCVCVSVCLFWPPLPVTSLDRWHPLALWLACQRLNMSMGAPLQASTFIYKCKFKPSLVLSPSHTCTALPLTVEDWFGCFPATETAAEWVLGSPRTLANNHEMLQIVNRDGGAGRRNDSHKMSQSRKLCMKAIEETFDPLFLLSYSNDASLQMSPHHGSEGNDSPHHILGVTTLSIHTHWFRIVGKHTSSSRSHHWFFSLRGKVLSSGLQLCICISNRMRLVWATDLSVSFHHNLTNIRLDFVKELNRISNANYTLVC